MQARNIHVKLQLLERKQGNEEATQKIPEILTQNDTKAYRFNCRIMEGTEDINYIDATRVLFVFSKDNKNTISMGEGQLDNTGVYYDVNSALDLRITGWLTCSVQLLGAGGEKLTVSEFQFEVRRDPTSLPSAPPIPPDYGALQNIIDQCIAATAAANQTISDADDAAKAANTAAGAANAAAQNATNTANQLVQDAQNGVFDGDSAYEVWLANGGTGTVQDYLASLKGDKGDPGDLLNATADKIKIDPAQIDPGGILNATHDRVMKALNALSTGGIIETGNNANGEYIKLSSGMMICSNITTYSILKNSVTEPPFTHSVTTSTVNLFIISGANQLGITTFAQKFSHPPFVIPHGTYSSGGYYAAYVAIGRWK